MIEVAKSNHEKSNDSIGVKVVEKISPPRTKPSPSFNSNKIEQHKGTAFEEKVIPLKAQNFTFKFGLTKKGIAESPNEKFDDNLPSTNSTVPQYVQKNLKELIHFHPDGLWCAELPSIYR